MKSKRWIKGLAVLVAAVLCFGFTGCKNIENPARTPFASDGYQGEDFEKTISALKEAGFINISTETMLTYSDDKAGTVGKVTIDGNHSFLLDSVYENNVPVVVAYYTILDEGERPEESEPEGEVAQPTGKEKLEVTFDIEVTGEEGKPVFVIETNLPDDTELELSLLWDDMFSYEDQTTTVKGGKAKSEPFTDNGEPLSGYSAFGITMFPASQPESVQSIIGEMGEYLTGSMVVTVDTYSYVWMEKTFGTEQEKPQEKISEDDMKAVIENALAAGFGDDYSVSLEGVVYTANVWQDGMAATALLAKDGNADTVVIWEQIRQTTTAATEKLQKLLEDNGHRDHLVVVNVLNDTNKENILLSVVAGMVVSDCTA